MELYLIALALGLLTFLISFLTFNPVVIVLTALLFAISVIVWKYGELITPMITKAFGITQRVGAMEIVPERDLLVRKWQGQFVAVKFLLLKFYGRSPSSEAFQKAVVSLPTNVRLSLLIRPVDLSTLIERLTEQRSFYEAKLQSAKDEAERRTLERKINHVESLLNKLASGEKPIEALAYAAIYERSRTKADAIRQAREKAYAIRGLLSSVLGAEVSEARDQRLLELLESELVGVLWNSS